MRVSTTPATPTGWRVRRPLRAASGRLDLLIERAGWSSALEALLRSSAHELRNPVQSVVLAARALDGDLTPERRRRYCDVLRRESARLAATLDDLSGMLEAPAKWHAAPVAVVELVEDGVRSFGPQLAAAEVVVGVASVGVERPARAVRQNVVQAFLAVLANAAEAVADQGGGTIAIQIEGRGTHLTVTVTDSGSGIPAVYRRRVFEPFFTTRQNRDALGLGLTAARSLLAPLGGSIAVLAPPSGVGASVRMRLRCWSSEPRTAGRRVPPSRAGRPSLR